MDEFVKQFLLSNKYISFGKLGALYINSDVIDDGEFNLSNYNIKFDSANSQPSQTQLNWFQNSAQAINETFDSYCNKLLYAIQTHGTVKIDGVGVFEKKEDTVCFSPTLNLQNPFTPISVKKIKKVPVPEVLQTIIEAEETENKLDETPVAKKMMYFWWILIIMLAAVLAFLFWNGFSLSALGNNSAIGYIGNVVLRR